MTSQMSHPGLTEADLRKYKEFMIPQPAVEQAYKNLQKAVNFRGGAPWMDKNALFKIKGTDDLDDEKMNKDANNGCKKQVFHYAEKDLGWWNEVVIQVQNDLSQDLVESQEFALFVHFHGGGFTTGDARHEAWKQKHIIEFGAQNPVILVYPNHPLMPWHDASDVLEAAKQFWKYLFSNSFKEHLQKLHPGLKARFTNICVSGDSAGAWMAMYSFACPHKEKNNRGENEPIDIGVVYLQYPMLKHYQRKIKPGGMTWLKEPVLLKEDIGEAALNLENAWKAYHKALVEAGLNRLQVPVGRPWAPGGMGTSFLGACYTYDNGTALWQKMFQHRTDIPDIVERLQGISENNGIARPRRIPEFIVYHGGKDENCPIEHTTAVFGDGGLIEKRYGERVFGFTDIKEKIMYNEHDPIMAQFGHGFDHDMSSKDEALVKYYDQLKAKLWTERE